MKKIFTLILITGAAATLQADIRVDVATGQVFTIPASAKINQCEFHNLFTQCGIRRIFAINSGLMGKEIHKQEDAYLSSIGTPTALRLLSDMKKLR